MEYHDDVYGPVHIGEPVLVALVGSAAVQRLKGVLQHGISGLLGITESITRYDHSMGAMILVRRLGGPVEEQIAALLHDVSHTAFSHVIDYVFGGHDSQSYHEEVKERYLTQTDVPDLLAEHGYDWRAFLDEASFPILEQPAPALCADRLDYFLRDALGLDLATPEQVAWVLAHLVVAGGRMAVDDIAVARWLGDTFMAADDASWSNFREVGLYELTAQAIKRGLAVGIVTEADLWSGDEVFWAKLQAGDDPQLRSLLNLISTETSFAWDEANPTFCISTKIRTIDPDLLQDGRLCPLSSLDTAFARRREAYIRQKEGIWPMRVIPPA